MMLPPGFIGDQFRQRQGKSAQEGDDQAMKYVLPFHRQIVAQV
jgi:hypothetical protein